MLHPLRSLLTMACVSLSFGACTAYHPTPDSSNGTALSGPGNSVNALVITREQIRDQNMDLLTAISAHVSSVQVRRSDDCPQITIRGQKSIGGPNEPAVYVDGARAADTCVLEMLRSEDAARVEIYPAGVTNRPGYAPDPSGLILVFLRGASST